SPPRRRPPATTGWEDVSSFVNVLLNGSGGRSKIQPGKIVVIERGNLVVARPIQARLRVGDFDGIRNARLVSAPRLFQLVLSEHHAFLRYCHLGLSRPQAVQR